MFSPFEFIWTLNSFSRVIWSSWSLSWSTKLSQGFVFLLFLFPPQILERQMARAMCLGQMAHISLSILIYGPEEKKSPFNGCSFFLFRDDVFKCHVYLWVRVWTHKGQTGCKFSVLGREELREWGTNNIFFLPNSPLRQIEYPAWMI